MTATPSKLQDTKLIAVIEAKRAGVPPVGGASTQDPFELILIK